jgi:hypothetical protein
MQNTSGRSLRSGRRQGRPVCEKTCHEQKFGGTDLLTVSDRHTVGVMSILRHTSPPALEHQAR